MGNGFMGQIRRAFIFGSIFTGAASLSKLFGETEDELDDVMKSIEKTVKTQKVFDSKLFKNIKR